MAADMAAMGFDPAAVARMRARAAAATTDDALAIHPDNVTAVRWFLAAQSQWRFIALSSLGGAAARRTGLDYPAVEATGRMMGLQPDANDFARLQILEGEALKAWAEAERK